PYVGLEAFRESKHDLFFGRQRLIEELVEKVADNRCMFVVGPSGSGKSSVVLAGLMPKLKSGAVKKSDKWRYFPPVVPGFDPLASLISLLQPPGSRPENWVQEHARALKEKPGHLLQLINEQTTEPAFIVVDQ